MSARALHTAVVRAAGALAATAAVALATAAGATGPGPWPAAVQQHLDRLARSCREVGARPGSSPAPVQTADLNGDGRPDFVVDEGAFDCEGAASLFSGSGGSMVAVYVGRPGGGARPAYEGGHFRLRLEPADAGAQTLWLELGGPLCGQRVAPSMAAAEYVGCWRPLSWDAGHRRLRLGPQSRIRPIE